MANPSLQIGNSNWAIKEDNLLGYSTAGTRFVPQPITMTRESAGTRVNSSGLVETVELLGSELVTNGSFTTDTDWTKGSNWTISGGSATSDGTDATSNLYQTVVDFTNKTFLVEGFASNVTQGFVYVSLGGSDLQIVVNSNGSFKHYVTISTANSTLFISARNNFIGSIDNVSVKESTKNNLARVDYDGTASSLLVEPERTNIAEYSENFISGNFWGFQSLSKIDNSIISPDGTQNADKLYPSSTGDFRGLTKGFGSSLNAAAYNLSTFVKKGGKDFFFFYNIGSPQGSNGCWFNLSTGVIGTVGSAYTNVKIEDVGNDWFRCSATLNYGGTGDYVYLLMSDYNGSLTASVNGTDGIYLWGTQIEEGSYGTSYIPTDGGTVTRVQDQYEKTGISNLINSDEGVLFLEMAALADDGTNRYISISSSTTPSDDYIYFRFMSTSNRVLCRTRVGGSTINTIEKTITDTTDYNKYAIKWKSGDYAFWINGVEVGTDTNSTIFGADVLNQIRFDFPVGSGTFPSKVKQLQVYNTALTDEQLLQLTGTSGTDFYESYAEMASALTYTIQ